MFKLLRGVWVIVFLLAFWPIVRADGPGDNVVEKVRPVPPPGIEIAASDRLELQTGADALEQTIQRLNGIDRLLPDVRIFAKAVADALKHNEFFGKDDVGRARALLKQGQDRAAALAIGQAPWTDATGLVVRGYVSKIDGSVQPYGLVVPESYAAQGAQRHRLDVWFHGRGENLSEVNFIADRTKNRGQFAPPDTFVLHPYGRYCNAFKFAGEVDVLEALDDVKKRYRIDDDRIAVRGFSMGGAACWQFAVLYSDRWCAANPGAGFAETPEFLRVFQNEKVAPPDYEQKLWHWYNCTDSAANLRHCPTVAYSGELDIQKQAADVMQKAMRGEGLELRHVIGPGTKHAYHPDAARTVDAAMTSIATRGRERVPLRVQLTTYTLKYNRMAWVTIDGLGEHWKRARVDAHIAGGDVAITRTENVTALTLDMPAGYCPLDPSATVTLDVDGTQIEAPKPLSDRSWRCEVHLSDGKWKLGPLGSVKSEEKKSEEKKSEEKKSEEKKSEEKKSDEKKADAAVAADARKAPTRPPRKQHGLQGPIDDAFMDSFVFVRPTGHSKHPAVEKWVHAELDRAIVHWRRQFRGDARVKDDVAVTDQDIATANLVLWGDPASNTVMSRIAERLPIRWTETEIAVGDRRFPADRHVAIQIYPNPLNPRRYVVLNSSFTFRDYDYLNNARQVPKLPDWAVVDLTTPPGSRYPGKIAAADFFDESWQLRRSK